MANVSIISSALASFSADLLEGLVLLVECIYSLTKWMSTRNAALSSWALIIWRDESKNASVTVSELQGKLLLPWTALRHGAISPPWPVGARELPAQSPSRKRAACYSPPPSRPLWRQSCSCSQLLNQVLFLFWVPRSPSHVPCLIFITMGSHRSPAEQPHGCSSSEPWSLDAFLLTENKEIFLWPS